MASSKLSSVQEYLDSISEDQKIHLLSLRKAILLGLDNGFEECMYYGMIGYVVPKSRYSQGYHCDPKLPLPFAGLAAQKNSINLYHMGLYVEKTLYDWFVNEYAQVCKYKLDIGKSCIRFKKYEDIPFDLITTLFQKMNVDDWISLYEKNLKK